VSKEGDPRRSVYVQKGHLRANKIMQMYQCWDVHMCVLKTPTLFVSCTDKTHRTRAGARGL